MDNTNRFDLMMETLTELDKETRPQPASASLSLKAVLDEAGSLPHEALFLGMAHDGLPLLFNLYDAVLGPILIAGDVKSGKTALLKMIARAAEYMHTPAEVQYGVVTTRPAEWVRFQFSKTNAGVYATRDDATSELLQSLVTWAHTNKGDQQSILLLIDDLEALINSNDQAGQNLRWLLLRGPNHRVWPIVTLNAARAVGLTDWLDFFRTRLFGRVQDADTAQLITGTANASLRYLVPGAQFALKEDNEWLGFWAPAID
jgi:Cdc6-like AAA superfamily ATPase